VNQEQERIYTLDEVICAVCSHFRIDPEQLREPGKIRPMTEARGVAAAIVRMSPHLRLTDLAAALGRDLSSLGKAAQRITTQSEASETIDQVLERLNSQMSKCQT
jgi:chromosomal replication initiation ATPase DnaA